MALHESVSPNSTPKKSRNGHKTHNKDKKNPYSDRGLDKFSALLTDLDEKRKKIYSQTDPEEIVMVRFAYKNSDECVPVVVKQKDKKEEKNTSDDSETVAIKKPKQSKESTANKNNNNLVRARNLRRLNKPSYYIAAVVILILFLLSIFGRSVTILCTCIAWYLVPVLKQSLSKSRRKGKVRISIPNKMEKQPEASSVLSSSSSPIQAHRKTG
ncbi:uncharacterized protein LOC105435310 [Cucumis sativus]|uniref:ZCF37 n=1 Tax=Cucumis sativus TaxID=3659 RepID=A0A0A0L2K9_CUCSA|nr:uncharacterized protein LOC105435310 [Cucumis sativus]KGN55274.1 hypothetical protein Csa_012419 [Cucumis sativus]